MQAIREQIACKQAPAKDSNRSNQVMRIETMNQVSISLSETPLETP